MKRVTIGRVAVPLWLYRLAVSPWLIFPFYMLAALLLLYQMVTSATLGVAGMIFDDQTSPPRHELVVGAAKELFIFFLTGVSGDQDRAIDDPRR